MSETEGILKFMTYKDIVNHFTREKIEDHCANLLAEMDAFIERRQFVNNACVADSVLFQAVIDYFTDIYRLKTFHGINKVNENKIHAYTAYWLVVRKPIQIIKDKDDDLDLPFINEQFVQSYLMSYLQASHETILIMDSDKENYENFARNLEYFLKYRTVTPQMIETMIEAFWAGRSFQHTVDAKCDSTLL